MAEEDFETEVSYRYTEAFPTGNIMWKGMWGRSREVKNYSIEWENTGTATLPVSLTCDVGKWVRAGRGGVRDGVCGESREVLRERWCLEDGRTYFLDEEGRFESFLRRAAVIYED